MPHIYVCFLWHMHQPLYKDLVTGEYKMPWTRLHALKDYYGMVKMLEDFPAIHQTFNLVPCLLAQLEDYAAGTAGDPFLRLALKPAEELNERERDFILQHFFQANPDKLIYRYPRYGELYDAWLAAGRNAARANFAAQDLRDLQVLSQLAWFDEEHLRKDELARSLVRKGRSFTTADQDALGRKETELIGRVLPVYREFAGRGQIEISTTPFYHPILPLLCDSNVAGIAHPYVALPSRFSHPRDALEQLKRAREFAAERFGAPPKGLWPSEGAISDDALHLAAEAGYQWFASDNGVLARTLDTTASPAITYRPYIWTQRDHRMHGLFRDHELSDLIGFVYMRMSAHEAADHFMRRVHENCAPLLAAGRDALVPVFLDGENAWEYYDANGRPFLRELYTRLSNDPGITAATISEALQAVEHGEMGRVFPGSWIDANFDIWIGAEEDNLAWEYLLRARQMYERVSSGKLPRVGQEKLLLAYEELLIAEGSDWFWWYGPEHESANRVEFDALFRACLTNVYTLIGQPPPEELLRPIIKVTVKEFHDRPTGPVRAVIDGEVTSYFEWLGAGVYHLDHRSGAMHGHRYLVHELRYGADGHHLFLRLDFVDKDLFRKDIHLRINVQSVQSTRPPITRATPLNGSSEGIESRCGSVCELKLPLSSVGVAPGHEIRFQISLWQDGLPVEALPPQGWIAFSTADPTDWV